MIDGDDKIEHPMAERLREAKRVLRRAKADAGVDYQEIADSLKRSVNIVYRMLDMRDNIHHLRLGDVPHGRRADRRGHGGPHREGRRVHCERGDHQHGARAAHRCPRRA